MTVTRSGTARRSVSPAFARCVLLCAALAGLLPGCGSGPQYLTLEGATMGTYYRVTASCPGVGRDTLSSAAEATLAEVNARMSTYQEASELSAFNRAPVDVWLPASTELRTVIRAAREISVMSAGAFDVTVGPLVNLWGFGPEGSISRSPSPEAIEEARQRVGNGYLELDDQRGALRKRRALYVDLSAIAKGYGVDQLVDRLAALGCADLLVDIGGEVAGRGHNPAGRPWQIGIEVPDPETFGAVQKIVPIGDMALATSGDYRNYLDLEDGRRVSHTVDPRTGMPVFHDLASVTVLHDSAMWADGLATALNVLGPEAGPALAEREGLAATFLIRRADGFEERYTPAMRNYLAAHP
ncbi:MAG: FAD:protein FMN transferase [Pseudomonadales bacterium]